MYVFLCFFFNLFDSLIVVRYLNLIHHRPFKLIKFTWERRFHAGFFLAFAFFLHAVCVYLLSQFRVCIFVFVSPIGTVNTLHQSCLCTSKLLVHKTMRYKILTFAYISRKHLPREKLGCRLFNFEIVLLITSLPLDPSKQKKSDCGCKWILNSLRRGKKTYPGILRLITKFLRKVLTTKISASFACTGQRYVIRHRKQTISS